MQNYIYEYTIIANSIWQKRVVRVTNTAKLVKSFGGLEFMNILQFSLW